VGCALAVRRRLIFPLQTLANLIEAIRAGDYTLRGRRAARGDTLGEVVREINELGATLQRQRLESLEAQAHANNVMDVHRIGREAVRALEPNLADSARAALRVPREHLIDRWSPFLSHVIEAQSLGATIVRAAEVTGGGFDGDVWSLETTKGRFVSRWVINCAGLFGDTIEQLLASSANDKVSPPAPAHALFLDRVTYPNDLYLPAE
jgi:glycine/D-amino acid oxidase-like deaminating enzyme